MRDVFMEILKPQIDAQIDERIQQHDQQRDRINLYGFVQRGRMNLNDAAEEAGVTVDQFRQDMDEYQKSQENLQLA